MLFGMENSTLNSGMFRLNPLDTPDVFLNIFCIVVPGSKCSQKKFSAQKKGSSTSDVKRPAGF
jgi:hypothetical protein